MGVLWIAANVTKREYIDPHGLHSGAKIREWAWNRAAGVLVLAMAEQWRGDHVILCNDSYQGADLYEEARTLFRDVTKEALDGFNDGEPFQDQIRGPEWDKLGERARADAEAAEMIPRCEEFDDYYGCLCKERRSDCPIPQEAADAAPADASGRTPLDVPATAE